LLREAEIALRLDELSAAESAFESALARDAECAPALAGLGQIAFRRGDAYAAIELIEQALERNPHLQDASVSDTLGRAHARVGELEAAIAIFRSSLEQAAADGDPITQLRFSVLLANALIDNRNFGAATELLGDALKIAHDDPLALARVYWSQSRLHTQRRSHESAARYARKALGLLSSSEHIYFRAKAHHLLAFAELDAGRADVALELLEAGLELLGNDASPHDRAEFRIEQARALAMLGRYEEAASLAMATSTDFQSGGHPIDVGRSYASLADALAKDGQTERSLELYELAIEFLDNQPGRYLSEALARYGEVLELTGRTDEAFYAYKRIARLQQDLAHDPTA
jgi:tetratricopeptide (TPR) repeat protein